MLIRVTKLHWNYMSYIYSWVKKQSLCVFFLIIIINLQGLFNLHKCLIKNVYKLIKLIRDQVKTIYAGSMARHLHDLHDPTANHWNFEMLRNSYDVTKLYCNFGKLQYSTEPLFRSKLFTKVSKLHKAVLQKHPSLNVAALNLSESVNHLLEPVLLREPSLDSLKSFEQFTA